MMWSSLCVSSVNEGWVHSSKRLVSIDFNDLMWVCQLTPSFFCGGLLVTRVSTMILLETNLPSQSFSMIFSASLYSISLFRLLITVPMFRFSNHFTNHTLLCPIQCECVDWRCNCHDRVEKSTLMKQWRKSLFFLVRLSFLFSFVVSTIKNCHFCFMLY